MEPHSFPSDGKRLHAWQPAPRSALRFPAYAVTAKLNALPLNTRYLMVSIAGSVIMISGLPL